VVDAIREMLTQIENAGNEGDGNYSRLVADLTEMYSGDASPRERNPLGEPPPSSRPPSALAATGPAGGAPGVEPPFVAASSAFSTPLRDKAPLPSATGEGGARLSATTPAAEAADVSKADTSIRVDVSLLDKLMNLVGELVLARNQIIQFKGLSNDAGFFGAKQRLNLITSELQEGVMKTRMQPIGNIWHKFPRVVRDLAKSCDKRVRLEMEGEGTELDKTLIEAIKDPLTHLVRNSVDHGIEKPKAACACARSTRAAR
jgi:two-component system, chemotaxis family, sensor kinase CheA